MQRRHFIKTTALSAVAISASGFIRFDGNRYVGDCETTTDILGPFYRPGSPVRNDLVIEGVAGTIVELSGIIKHNDCKTPYPKAKIEIWHCSLPQSMIMFQMNTATGAPLIATRKGIIHFELFCPFLMLFQLEI